MSNPQKPSPAPAPGHTPRVHHQPQPGLGGTPVQGNNPGEPVSLEDYNTAAISNNMLRHLPDTVVYEGDQPEEPPTATPPKPNPPIPSDPAARDAGDGVYTGLTTKTGTFWTAVRKASRLGYLLDGFNSRAVRVALAFNSTQISDGAVAVIKAVESDPKAACMEVDPEALGKDVALLLRVHRAQEQIDSIKQVLDANESVVLSRIFNTVDGGLKLGASVIAGDGNLSFVLGPALAIRKDPANLALATKASNARADKATRADEQTKMQAATPSPVPPSTTTVISSTPVVESNRAAFDKISKK